MTLLQAEQVKITQNHLAIFYELMTTHHDDHNASKIIELYEKLMNRTYTISFTGHFSAGKSSMINTLLEKEILPKSPIPTSGNIVEITSGEGLARVYFNDDTSVIYEKPYDIEMIQEFCKDNQSVKKVALHTDEGTLPTGCMIVDTPGIDAADDADRLMTESSLHLVDHLFYVMDYNHVQSEVNLYFLKQIQEQAIPFSVIINQVDKHNEQEIAFNNFTDSIKQTFNLWGINPENIFYSSLVDWENEYNQFEQIRAYLDYLLSSDRDIQYGISQSLNKIIEVHKRYLQELYEKDVSETVNESTPEIDSATYDDMKEKLEALNMLANDCKRTFQADLHQTLKNAYLMPASLREQATLFLDSRQRNFKVGLLGAKKKTQLEKKLRLENFLESLKKNIDATIQWNFRDKVIAMLNKNKLDHPALIQSTKQLSIDYTADDLISNVKQGAQINGEYVLNYTNDVSAHIKNKYKNQAWELWEQIEAEIIKQTATDISELEHKLQKAENVHQQRLQKDNLEKELVTKYKQLDDQLTDPRPKESSIFHMEEIIHEKYQSASKEGRLPATYEKQVTQKTYEEKEQSVTHGKPSISQVANIVDETIQTIEDLSGFQTIIEDLRMKREKITNRTLTIALFGAFSAGKSSFANALLGKGLLPSSPNPTTAVINQISPVTESNKHGDVLIQIKNEQDLINDLVMITKDLSPIQTDLNGLIHWIKEEKVAQSDHLNKIHQAYIEAIVHGYPFMSEQLGQPISITLEDFAMYITDETKACFIEIVTLYYDCPLTRLGITLVDTPGADSVNARHTSVAFDYIKQADAILYVTYYNHALSRADRDFLIQLGRVKDSFQLDKMFFIINASDLAENQVELQLVQNYVEEQLLHLGIRSPKIFPVSSKQSLENKLNQHLLNEEMQAFENMFYQFINEDLAALSIQSILWDVERSYLDLTNHLQTVQLNEQEKDQYIHDLEQKKSLFKKVIDEPKADIYEERIIQRIDRQFHYVQERLSIKFHDLFKDRFNPTTVTDSGRKAIKQLERNFDRLIDDTGYELLQESRAVSLRVESFLTKLTIEVYKDFQARTQKIDRKFNLPIVDLDKLTTPAYEQAFLDLDHLPFHKVLRQFKNTKDFFEKNGRDLMRDKLLEEISPEINQYVKINQKIMMASYLHQWEILFENNKKQVKDNIYSYIDNHIAMITNTSDLKSLEEKQQKLAMIVDESLKKDD